MNSGNKRSFTFKALLYKELLVRCLSICIVRGCLLENKQYVQQKHLRISRDTFDQ